MEKVTKSIKIVSNIEETRKKVEELADLINKANSIIEEMAKKGLEVKLEVE